MKCSVKGCNNYVTFKFPKNENLRTKWLEAIRQPDLKPHTKHGVCKNHFKIELVLQRNLTYDGDAERIHLSKGAIPSIFPWTSTQTDSNLVLITKTANKYSRQPIQAIYLKEEFADISGKLSNKGKSSCHLLKSSTQIHSNELFLSSNIQPYEETITNQSHINEDNVIVNCTNRDTDQYGNQSVRNVLNEHNYTGKKLKDDKCVQTIRQPRYTIESFKDDPKGILLFTGLESYEKFMTVFSSLDSRKAHSLMYKKNAYIEDISIENQLFLTLWKLRKNCCDSELGQHFCLSEVAVGNIFKMWIPFIADQWSKMDIWPSNELIMYYMPENFKNDLLAARKRMDGTEELIERPRNPKLQLVFSLCKNNTTLKTVLENLSVKGSTVPDRAYIKSVKRLLKTYEILSTKLKHHLVPMASEIIGICVMLCNFNYTKTT